MKWGLLARQSRNGTPVCRLPLLNIKVGTTGGRAGELFAEQGLNLVDVSGHDHESAESDGVNAGGAPDGDQPAGTLDTAGERATTVVTPRYGLIDATA